PAALVVEPQTEQHVRVLEPCELRALEQALVHRDRLADLSLLAVQVAEDHVHFERVGVQAGRLRQLLDREIDLVGDEEVEPEQIMWRLARAATVEPLAVAQLLPLPRLAARQADEEREKPREEHGVLTHGREASP